MAPNEKTYSNNPSGGHDARKAAGQARAQQIRELPGAELAAFCLPNELAGEQNTRAYWEQMNQKELEYQSQFDPWAAVELKRRNGELPR